MKSNRSKRKKLAGSETFARPSAKAPSSPTIPPWLNNDWFLGLVLVLAVVLVYRPVWYAGFVWDDGSILTTNPVIIGPLGLKEIWTTHAADICPLTLTTFWVEHSWWGLAPLPYHLVNVLMHGVGAVVLWRVLRALEIPGAWLGAALWAVHPVNVESVAWITEMKNTQSALFFLLSILFFVKWLRAGNSVGQKQAGWNYPLTLLFAALAMASKSSTVILPAVLCLCAWWVEGRWNWRNLIKVGPIFLMSMAVAVLSLWTEGLQLAKITEPQWARTWPERLVTAGDAVWFYLGKLLWPHPLIVIYPRWQIEATQPLSYLPLFAVVVVFFILWLKRKSWSRPYLFAWGYFLVALFPIIGFIDQPFFRNSFVADHFQYLAGIGPLALAGAGMVRLADFVLPKRRSLQFGLCALPLLFLGILSWRQIGAYESEITLWTATLAKNPNCWLGHYDLGNALIQQGRADEAIAQFQKAMEIDPKNPEAYNNLGWVLMQQGHRVEAMGLFNTALEINPTYAEAHNNLGNALFQNRQIDLAAAQYQKASEINPNFPDYHNNLGVTLALEGRVDEAIAQIQEALRLKPDYGEARKNLAKMQAMRQQNPAPK